MHKKIKEGTTGIRDNFEFARNKRTFFGGRKKKQIESSRTQRKKIIKIKEKRESERGKKDQSRFLKH